MASIVTGAPRTELSWSASSNKSLYTSTRRWRTSAAGLSTAVRSELTTHDHGASSSTTRTDRPNCWLSSRTHARACCLLPPQHDA